MAEKKELTEREKSQLIKRKLKHISVERQPERWLVTEWPLLHSVLGDPIRGIPYGKIIEISGTPGSGKSGLALELCSVAHNDGAKIGWCDFELVWDDEWSAAHNLSPDDVALFYPDVVTGGSKVKKLAKKKAVEAEEDEDQGADTTKRHLLSAEEVLKEAETWIESKLSENPSCKVCLAMDSLPAMLPAAAEERDLTEGQPQGGFAAFLTRMLQKWVPLCFTHNVMLILINHVRTKPGVAFGDPTYEPGGSALYHYSSIKVRMRRAGAKTGKIINKGRQIGIKGFIKNKKNRVGGLEDTSIGYKFFFRRPMKFTTYEEMKQLTSQGENQ